MTDQNLPETPLETESYRALIKALDHAPVAIGVFNKNGGLLYMNKLFRKFHWQDRSDVKMESFADFINSGMFSGWQVDPKAYFAKVLSNLQETGEHHDQVEIDGRILCIHDVMFDDGLILSTQKDMTDRIRTEREIAYLASHDMMTGLANRASFEAQLAQAIQLNAQSHGHFHVLMADLDRFKQINDTYGHAAGDAVLKEISRRFRACLGSSDFVARLGGDEFVFLCRDDEASAEALGGRLAACGRKPIRFEGNWLSVGVSVGYCTFPQDGHNQETLLRAADVALYQAKTVGHGAVKRYNSQEQAA